MSERVKLDINKIPEELYDAILDEFRWRFGSDIVFVDWEISAEIEKEEVK